MWTLWRKCIGTGGEKECRTRARTNVGAESVRISVMRRRSLHLYRSSIICAHPQGRMQLLETGIPGKFRALSPWGFATKSLFLNEWKVCFSLRKPCCERLSFPLVDKRVSNRFTSSFKQDCRPAENAVGVYEVLEIELLNPLTSPVRSLLVTHCSAHAIWFREIRGQGVRVIPTGRGFPAYGCWIGEDWSMC